MKHLFSSLALCLATIAGFAQCEADHTVEASSFMYAPMSLTIEQGQSVAFVNNQGLHDVNGVTNTITGEPFNNPTEFSLNAISGDAEGACMGIVTFDVAGTYNYDCSIGNHAEQGMVGTIIVNPAPVTTTIWDIVEGSPDHTYLETALLQQDLDGALNDTTVLTLFAPTNAAFEAAAAAYQTDIAGLLALPYLTEILLYHVTGGAVMSTDLSDGQVVTMLNEGTATVTIDMGVFINNAQVTGEDNIADNGVVHILDALIQPATDGIQEAQASWTVMPNPASDEVRFAGLAAEATAVVLDLTGRQVAQLAAGNNILAVGHMAPGTYVVAVTSNGSITTSKLVVR